jgi:hypothetical protein
MATGTTLGLGVADAARVLNLTPNAVRKRIKRGSLAAYKDGDDWRVIVSDGEPRPIPQPTPRPRPEPTSQPTPRPIPNNADGITRDPIRQAQQLALIQEIIAPFVAELGETKHRLGIAETELQHERERRTAIETERDELRLLLAAASAPPGDAQITPAASDDLPIAAEAQPRRSWWQRLWHGPSEMPV